MAGTKKRWKKRTSSKELHRGEPLEKIGVANVLSYLRVGYIYKRLKYRFQFLTAL